MTLVSMWIGLQAAMAGVAVEQDCGTEPARQVSVEMACGSLRLVGTDRPNVRVSGSVDDAKGLHVSSSGGRVRISLETVSGWMGSRQNCGDLQIEVPRSASAQLATISAPIEAREVLGALAIESVSGNASVYGAPASIDLETVSGDIRISSPSQDVEVETVSGQVLAEGPGGSVELSSVSGDLTLRAGAELRRVEVGSVSGNVSVSGALARGATLEAETHSGNVVLTLPANTSASIETSTFSGRVQNALGATVGDGDSHVEVSTFSGTVSILRRE